LGGVVTVDLVGMDLAGLEARRAVLYAELAGVGDFRRGSLNAVRRRCGRANCACAREGHPGHGPQHNLTRWAGGKTVNVRVRPGPELDKVTREVAAWQRFQGLVEAIAAVNEAICAVRPVAAAPADAAPGSPGEKGGSSTGPEPGSKPGSRRTSPPK
jgi:hypothetical protein